MIKKGDRLVAIEDVDAAGVTTWAAAYTGGFDCTIPRGTVLISLQDQFPGAKFLMAVPDRYQDLEKLMVPESDRLHKKYGGYHLVLKSGDVGRKFFVAPG